MNKVKDTGGAVPQTLLSELQDLALLNREHSFPSALLQEPRSPAQRVLHWIRSRLFGSYLQREQEFNARLVRTLNELARRVDAPEVRQQDDNRLSLHAVERQIGEGVRRAFAELNARQNDLEAQSRRFEVELQTLDSVCRGLERIIATLDSGGSSAHAAHSDGTVPDYRYLLLENRYRGSEEEIRRRVSRYIDTFRGLGPEPVLEIGSGRGELQQLFREAGIPSYGIELDAAMVERCAQQGLEVAPAEAIEHLRTVAPRSLAGVIAIQVVEHLPRPVLEELLALCREKVKPGGRIVFETINTESLVALCHNYFRDPTHAAPLHPETLRYLLELSGLKVLGVERLSPYSPAETLEEIHAAEFLTPRWAALAERVNGNIRRLNELLFGHQDYCIIAEPG